jgi:hypothetical protein
MNKTVKILAVLLAAQLLLAAGIGLSDRGVTATSEPVALVSFDPKNIDRITLEGPEDAKVTLAKKDGNWVLPESAGFPANSNKVKQLFERLKALRSGTPVATSHGARERFKVSDDTFERRISLSRGDETLARLYLGSSPGMRLIHARNEADNGIHAVKLAAYDVPVTAAEWEDKSVLTLSKSTISSIQINGLTLQRGSRETGQDKAAGESSPQPAWQAEGLEQGKALTAEAVDKLAGLLADLRFERVLGQEASEEYGLDDPVLSAKLTLKAGTTLTYQLGKTKDKEEYTLKVSNRSEYFRMANYKAKPLIEAASMEKLTETITQADEEETTSEQPSES